MEKRYKAQVSVEMLAIVGVIVLGALIFATYYLSSVNRYIDRAVDLDIDLSTLIPTDPTGNFPVEPPIEPPLPPLSCGDGIIQPPEQCEPPSTLIMACSDYDPGYTSGFVFCSSSCEIDTSGCSGIPTPGFCGDEIIQPPEQCDGTNLMGLSCTDFIDPISGNPFIGGDLGCNLPSSPNECTFDTSNCISSNTFVFEVRVEPESASANPNVNYPTSISIDFDPEGLGVVSDWVDVNVFVQNDLGGFLAYTNNCSYDNQPIPANAQGKYITRFYPIHSPSNKDIKCSANGIYYFTFTGVDNLGNTNSKQLIFEVPESTPPIFSLCKDQTNSNGYADICVNRFISQEENIPGVGTAKFYINYPDFAEENKIIPICENNSNGNLCFSLGFT